MTTPHSDASGPGPSGSLLSDPALRGRLATIAPWTNHPQSIRAVFFDAGFTLIRPNPSTTAIIARVLTREGVATTEEQIRVAQHQAERHFFSGQHVQKSTWADNAAINRAWLGYFHEMVADVIPDNPELLEHCLQAILVEFDKHSAWQVYEDVLPTLRVLREHFTLGIISDWGIGLGAILRDLDLTRYFDFLVVSATSRRSKPDPHLFELALQRGNALGDYTLYIGDSYVQDVLGSRAAGINPILLDRRQRFNPLQFDCPVVAHLTDLLELLERERWQ